MRVLPRQEVFIEWLNENERNTQLDHYSLSPYVVNEYRVEEKSIYVDYDFLVIDSAQKDFELFKRLDGAYASQQFPKELCKVRLKETYTWESQGDKETLDENYLRDTLDVDVNGVSWDDEEVTDAVVEMATCWYDESAFGEALVKTYGADKQIPDFIPRKLIPYFESCIKSYLDWLKDVQSQQIVKAVAGFNLELWDKLGMSFNPNGRYSQKEMDAKVFLDAEGGFEDLIFSLRINKSTGNTKATVSNLKGEKIGNHIVSESDAINWFKSLSREFSELWESVNASVASSFNQTK